MVLRDAAAELIMAIAYYVIGCAMPLYAATFHAFRRYYC